MMGLFFLIVSTVGILRPIKNALALDGLAATQFYRVYLIGAIAVLYVPLYNLLAERLRWRVLIPAVSVFFALNLVAFRLLYREGSALFGVVFYGWYDLYAATLVTQFFIATQLFFNVREARSAYPPVIIAGSLGATLGGVITGFFAQRVGTPNLLLVAAALVVIFAIALPLVWRTETAGGGLGRSSVAAGSARGVGEIVRVFSNRHVQGIALIVLLMVLTKQLVDYQYNEAVAVHQGDRDAIASFQGWVFAVKDWLPILVLIWLRPVLKRGGLALAVSLLPATMLLATLGLVVWWGVWMASIAKTLDGALRYSAERASREILYVPVPDDIKLKAKAYIDVGVEKGIGKVGSALLIFLLLLVADYRQIALAAAALAAGWLAVSLALRREYLLALASAIQGRFASLRGVFASLTDARALPILRSTLSSGTSLERAFVLDLLSRADRSDIVSLSQEVHGLLSHASAQIREQALRVLARAPEAIVADDVRAQLSHEDPSVQEAAVHALLRSADDREKEVAGLLQADNPSVRRAALTVLAREEVTDPRSGRVSESLLSELADAARNGDFESRLELALAIGAFPDAADTRGLLTPLLHDSQPLVAAAALNSAGLLGSPELFPQMVDGLRSPATRAAARGALVRQGPEALKPLTERLQDSGSHPRIRRAIPSVLARIPTQDTVDALLESIAAPATDALLDHRSLKALGTLRARYPELRFDRNLILAATEREVTAARLYATALQTLQDLEGAGAAKGLLEQALEEGWRARREDVFRCVGLLFSPEQVYRCYLAVVSGGSRAKANALELLEQTVGHAGFSRLAPVLLESDGGEPAAGNPKEVLERLWDDNDSWIARCALWTAAELDPDWLLGELARTRPINPEARQAAESLMGRLGAETDVEPNGGDGMDLIERVLLLRKVDLLEGARSAHLAMLASIAEEIEVEAGESLVREGEPADALFVVIRGEVELDGLAGETVSVGEGTPIGTWTLIDEEPSPVGARVTERARLLRISRLDFQDVLADNPELALALMRGLAHRLRSLVGKPNPGEWRSR